MRGHAGLTTERWQTLTMLEQLGNIGSEVGRAIRAKEQGNDRRFAGALDRGLELFDLTLADDRGAGHGRREIARAREVVCDFLVGNNEYRSTSEDRSRAAWRYTPASALHRCVQLSVLGRQSV